MAKAQKLAFSGKEVVFIDAAMARFAGDAFTLKIRLNEVRVFGISFLERAIYLLTLFEKTLLRCQKAHICPHCAGLWGVGFVRNKISFSD